MKKILKGLICVSLAGAMAAGMVGAAGCKDNNNPGSGAHIVYRDSETSPLRLAIGAVDEKFNPMYYTSLNDGTIASLTQVSLITADAEGKLAVGEDQPTVALDYLETYYDAQDKKLATGDGRTITALPGGNTEGDANGYTTYEFVIKNGMKFSDGEPLTVMDVLFNLYVFLDPRYSGSNTIYSTRIKGLKAYRDNNPNAVDDGTGSTMNPTLYSNANKRYEDLFKWADNKSTTYSEADLDKVTDLYKDEINSSWNSIATSYPTVYEDYYFDEAWKAFFFMEGIFEEQKRPNDNGVDVRFKDKNGKYPTEVDPDDVTGVISDRGQGLITMMNAATTDALIKDYIARNPGVSEEYAKLALQKETALDYLHAANTEGKSGIKKILQDYSFASTVINAFYDDELTNDTKKQERLVKSIEGITVSRSDTFNGKSLSEEHDILKIKVVGVDPKAKWNFGFTVSPMHYYSTHNFEGKDYIKAAMDEYKAGKVYDGTATEFGVEYGDVNFINEVLSASNKNGLPVGAGPYKCCTYQYGQSNLNASTFFYGYMAFFERNTYFETMGEEIENAKIKYVTYKVTNDDQIVNSLKAGEIDYGEPIAKADNQSALLGMSQITYQTGGYGYVGINPKYVPDIEIRRAIMMAFDTSHLRDYYGNSLVNVINRPMSNTSWIYTDGYYDPASEPYYTRATTAQQIIDYIQANGEWRYEGGTWRNRSTGAVGLSFDFTIAGESTDHPAYDMFTYAKRLLESAGFSISVGTDPRALTKLVTGDLTVWAAAWSSSIDPDPYQIYSIYSQASSTKNWNKDNIVRNPQDFPMENLIANVLNEKIMAGRQTLDPEERAAIYAESTTTITKKEDIKTEAQLRQLSTLDLIMQMAVEFPTYQRYDLCVFNGNVLDRNSMTAKPSHNMGPISELWKVSYHIRPEEPAPETGTN